MYGWTPDGVDVQQHQLSLDGLVSTAQRHDSGSAQCVGGGGWFKRPKLASAAQTERVVGARCGQRREVGEGQLP